MMKYPVCLRYLRTQVLCTLEPVAYSLKQVVKDKVNVLGSIMLLHRRFLVNHLKRRLQHLLVELV
jgi:hypothetical protein